MLSFTIPRHGCRGFAVPKSPAHFQCNLTAAPTASNSAAIYLSLHAAASDGLQVGIFSDALASLPCLLSEICIITRSGGSASPPHHPTDPDAQMSSDLTTMSSISISNCGNATCAIWPWETNEDRCKCCYVIIVNGLADQGESFCRVPF